MKNTRRGVTVTAGAAALRKRFGTSRRLERFEQWSDPGESRRLVEVAEATATRPLPVGMLAGRTSRSMCKTI